LRNVNLSMIAPEIESFRADYGDERSFRADYAATHRRVISILGRVLSEARDFDSKQNSEFLWKPHADSLTVLLELAKVALEQSTKMVSLAEQRGLADKANAMKTSAQRLQNDMQRAARELEAITSAAR
jgi:hypothetical protein